MTTMTAVEIDGQKVRALREAGFMTREEFGKKVKLHPDHVGRIERGEVSPRIPTIRKIADALGVDPNELVERGGGAYTER